MSRPWSLDIDMTLALQWLTIRNEQRPIAAEVARLLADPGQLGA